MKRRILSVISIPDGPGPIGKAKIRCLVVLLVGVVAISAGVGVGLLIRGYFSTSVDRSRVEDLRSEIAFLEGKVSQFEQGVGVLRKRMGALREMEDSVRSLVFPNEIAGNYLSLPDSDTQTDSDISFRLNSLLAEARVQRKDYAEILARLDTDGTLRARVPSIPPLGGYIIRRFGLGEDPFTKRVRFHQGIDITAPKGTPIYAPADGVVKFAGFERDMGLLLIIDHGYGYRTYYGHCSSLRVGKGKVVRRGEIIASVGKTGRSTGPHLYNEVRFQGKSIDPEKLLLGLPHLSETGTSSIKGLTGS